MSVVTKAMADAPRDGTLIRMRLRDGTDIVGSYSDKWWGWIDHSDVRPLIRGDIAFSGWEPIGDEELRQIRQQSLIRPERGRVPAAAISAAVGKQASAIVRARRPRR